MENNLNTRELMTEIVNLRNRVFILEKIKTLTEELLDYDLSDVPNTLFEDLCKSLIQYNRFEEIK